MTDFELRQEVEGFRGIEFLRLSNCVIDGQQRLMALEMYFTDQLAVPASDGTLTLWSEVSAPDRRRFQNTVFSRGTIRERDEMKLRELYDVMNFGGAAHEEHERASTHTHLVRVGDRFFVDRSDTASLTAAQEQARHEAIVRYSRSRSPPAHLMRAHLGMAEAGESSPLLMPSERQEGQFDHVTQNRRSSVLRRPSPVPNLRRDGRRCASSTL